MENEQNPEKSQMFNGLSSVQTVLWNLRSWLKSLMLLLSPDWGSVVLASPSTSLFSSPLSLSTDKSSGWGRVLACRAECHLQEGNWAVHFSTVILWSTSPEDYSGAKPLFCQKSVCFTVTLVIPILDATIWKNPANKKTCSWNLYNDSIKAGASLT